MKLGLINHKSYILSMGGYGFGYYGSHVCIKEKEIEADPGGSASLVNRVPEHCERDVVYSALLTVGASTLEVEPCPSGSALELAVKLIAEPYRDEPSKCFFRYSVCTAPWASEEEFSRRGDSFRNHHALLI